MPPDSLPKNLARLQSDMLDWLLKGKGALGQAVVSHPPMTTETRLGIYANAYRARLTEALQENYPALHTLLGDERFYTLCEQYIDHTPAHHFSIRYFGDRLAALLSQKPEYRFQPVVAEMARFEWALRAAFDAADTAPTSREQLQEIPPESWPGVNLQAIPAMQILELQWNVPGLWQAIDEENEPVPAERLEQAIPWLIWRQDLRVYFRSLAEDEAWALAQLDRGLEFTGLCEGLTQWHDSQQAAQRSAELMLSWVDAGIIVLTSS